MLCQQCGKNPANHTFVDIRDNKMSEIRLCDECAAQRRESSAAEQHQFDFPKIVTGMMDEMTDTEEERVGHVQCPRCGLLFSAFKETGRLGCSDCYSAFQFQLRPLLRRIHGDTRHRGKIPARDGEGAARFRQIHRLHDELQRAIEREEFEHAAGIRDEIRRLEKELQAGRTEESK